MNNDNILFVFQSH